MISVIVPYYNEASVIADCLISLSKQTVPIEIVLIDDGSSDGSADVVSRTIDTYTIRHVTLLSQSHLGPAVARNTGAEHANGTILVFADADMTFDPLYVERLTSPILSGSTNGTFTKDERVENWDNVWARCWNFNEGIGTDRRVPSTHPDVSSVFRAIRKREYDRVGGFDPIGFTDDWTLSRKLGYKATAADGAVCYHKNPSTLIEVYVQERWIGKNEFISGSALRKLRSILWFNPVVQALRGLFVVFKFHEPAYMVFEAVYYSAILVSVLRSYKGESKNK